MVRGNEDFIKVGLAGHHRVQVIERFEDARGCLLKVIVDGL